MDIRIGFTPTVARFLVLLVTALITTACGTASDGVLPSGPSAISGTATVNGTVMSSSVASTTVGVSSTAVSSRVASDGRFTLLNVPDGPIELRLTGPGLDVRIDLGVVRAGEVLSITIRVNGNTAILENVTRRPRVEEDDELTGVVSRVAGRCPDLTFMVSQRSVRTNGGTFFRRVACDLLVNGQLVEVEGRADASGVVLATKVQLEEAVQVERTGGITGLGGSCPDLSFSINGRGFFTNNATEFDDVSCTRLREGTNVEAKGHVQSNGQVLAERVRLR